MNKFIIIATLSSLLLAGCLLDPDMSKVSLGMTKQEVIAALGKPETVAAKGNYEYLMYEGEASYSDGRLGGEFYFVRLVDGKVESYGKKGDFDSTKNDALDINIKTK